MKPYDGNNPTLPPPLKRSRTKKVFLIIICVLGGIIVLPIVFLIILGLLWRSNDRSPQNDAIWTEANFTDDYGKPIDEKYVYTDLVGTFSNSATTDSPLKVRLMVSKDSTMEIALYEYGSEMVKDQIHSMKIRHNDSIIYRDDYFGISKDGWGYLAYRKNKNNICDERTYMYNGGKFEFVLTEKREFGGVPSTYKFQITDASIIGEAIKLLNKDNK